MTDLVFLEPNKLGSEPFTTSDVIAAQAQISYRSVQRMIERHENDLAEFGQVRFQITPVKYARGTNDKKIYQLNEQQATLLITYLKNTPPVRQFKKDLVQEFYRMRRELTRRQIFRDAGKPIRRTLTDAIRDSGEDGRMHGHAYGTYTDLAYKAATGKIARILRKERGASAKAIAADFLTSDELSAYNKAEERLTVLLDMGLTYDQIKTLLLVQTSKRLAG
ncbi:Rha family transcriptional regulator [Anaerotruncus colihominis]|uniref:Rha family transcriptional regulator n=1 Tax=Anaerotruncus colihominis TaxID=169435 RepID=UPI00294303D7|nr:Rha family transcriptional regulator [Anaerotruncus colihominis]